MSKRSLFTAITPLPSGVTRSAAINWLHDHSSLIRLNPLVLRFSPSTPPPNSPPDELDCHWYEITDLINYAVAKSEVTYKACFNDLPYGVQTHVYAPAGLEIRERWTVGGNEYGEPREVMELGLNAPREGLYIREDVDMRCNVFLSGYVKRNLGKAHKVVLQRIGALAGPAKDDGHTGGFTQYTAGTISRPVSRDESIIAVNDSSFQHPSSLYSGYSIPDRLQRPSPTSRPSSANTPCYCVGRHYPDCAQFVRTPVQPKLDNWSPAVDDKDLPRLPRDSGLHSHWHHIEIPAMDDLTPVNGHVNVAVPDAQLRDAGFNISRKPVSPNSPIGLLGISIGDAQTEARASETPQSSMAHEDEDLRPRPLVPQRIVSGATGL